MKKVILFLLLAISLVACKKDSVEDQGPQTYSDRIELSNPKVTPDSIILTWSILDNANFRAYTVIRKEDPAQAGTPIFSSYDKMKTRYVDKMVPYNPYLEYQVTAQLASGLILVSNIVVVNRPEIKLLNIKPFDVQFDQQNRKLYFFEKEGTISIYDLPSGAISKTLNTAATLGFSDFGVYNGVKELYVPRNDGWVFIYNAQTLEKIDQLSVGAAASCLVANNNLLYVSTASAGWPYKPLKVYNRATKSLLGETYGRDMARFKKVPGTNTELIEITINIGPTDQAFYSFSSSGTFLTSATDRYHGDYPIEHSIFEMFPSGARYITSSSGTIFNKSMVYETSLPRGNLQFTSFDFDTQNNLILAGTTTKTIEAYSLTNYNHMRTLSTKAFPYRIFNDGSNGILCVSSSKVANYYQAADKIIIETVK